MKFRRSPGNALKNYIAINWKLRTDGYICRYIWLTKLHWDDISKLIGSVTSNEIIVIIKIPPFNKNLGLYWLSDEFRQAIRENYYSCLSNYSTKGKDKEN